MARRHQRGTIERLLRRRERDGLTYRELSEESGIPIPTLAWWAGKLEREGWDPDLETDGGLVEVEIVEDEAPAGEAAIVIVIHDELKLVVPPDATDSHLRRILRVLASC